MTSNTQRAREIFADVGVLVSRAGLNWRVEWQGRHPKIIITDGQVERKVPFSMSHRPRSQDIRRMKAADVARTIRLFQEARQA